MKPSLRFSPRLSAVIFLFVLGFATSAFAGPPLICHPFDIGNAKSLPWSGTGWDLSGNENYDAKNLTQDTLAILDAGAPVIVRMETLRRATLYARKDPLVAKELLTRLYQRTTGAHAEAYAWFDAGYFAAALSQWTGKDQNPAAGIDGYSMVRKAIALRNGQDAEMEFAAALITLSPARPEHQQHAQQAIAGAKTDSLLARNLASHFLGAKQTVAEAIGKNEGK
jgi:hypothetical protein